MLAVSRWPTKSHDFIFVQKNETIKTEKKLVLYVYVYGLMDMAFTRHDLPSIKNNNKNEALHKKTPPN